MFSMLSLGVNRIILFLFTGGVLHLLFYLFVSSATISRKIFRICIPFFWGGLLLVFFSISYIRRPPEDRFRIACFPVTSSESEHWLDMTISDRLNDLLRTANPQECLAYPLDWTYDSVYPDSVSNISYLLSYGNRIGLDFLITEQIQGLFAEGCEILLSLYYLQDDTCLLEMTDSLYFDRSDEFLQHAAREILNHSDIGYDSLSDLKSLPFVLWEPYGWGRYHYLSGDLRRADEAYRRGIDIDSTRAVMKKGLANVLLNKAFQRHAEGEFIEDIYLETTALLRQVLKMDSTDGEAHHLLGRAYLQSERWNKAEKSLCEALRWETDDPWIYFYLSRLHSSRYKESGFENKVQLLKYAVTLNPALEQAWLALGEELYFKNKPEDAKDAYLKLLAIHPGSLDGLLALGKLYVFQNDILNIIRTYERLLELSPRNADAHYNLGIAYYNDDKVDEAIRFFHRAIELSNHIDSHFYLGVIYADRNEIDRAIEYFRSRIRLRKEFNDPFAEEARKHLNRLLQNGES